jgi:hypothetical protein
MLLTFSKESLEKMTRGRKITTIRRNPEIWENFIDNNKPPILHIYEGNPRNGGKKVCEITLWFMIPAYGFQFGDLHAILDGFETVEDLWDRLRELYGMTHEEVLKEKWAIIGMQIPTNLHLIEWVDKDEAIYK